MLSFEVIKKIEDFVYAKPRSIQEIARHINKNWRTADRYIQEIQTQQGTLSTRVFREGTRGALKIVFWSSIEKASSTIFQEELEKQIYAGRKKEDFSAFDIFQHVKDKNKKITIENEKSEEQTNTKDLSILFSEAEKQVIIFSGNLSFINLEYNKILIIDIIENLMKRGVSIKIICRIDIAGKENIDRILSLNFKLGKELIEIRHKEQPLRCIIIDKKVLRIKEIKEPTGRKNELKNKIFLFYTIKDKEWIEWLTKIFFKMFSFSIDSKKRLEELNRII